jgi:hypothetical protein
LQEKTVNQQLSALLLSASLLCAPLATAASAQSGAPQTSYQVAAIGQTAHYTHGRKHHRMRNAALLVGGGLVARHIYRKHKARKAGH